MGCGTSKTTATANGGHLTHYQKQELRRSLEQQQQKQREEEEEEEEEQEEKEKEKEKEKEEDEEQQQKQPKQQRQQNINDTAVVRGEVTSSPSVIDNNCGSAPEPFPPSTKKKEYIPDLSVFDAIDNHALQAPTSAADSVENLVNYLVSVCTNNLEKARVLFRWISNNIKYDGDSFKNGDITSAKCTPEFVLRTGLGVCSGYANLFQAMCRQVDIPCEVISGHAKGWSSSPDDQLQDKDSNHAWNAVYLDNTWRLIDCTWAAGTLNGNYEFTCKYAEFYFLTDPEAFAYTHFPHDKHRKNSEDWQLLSTPWTLRRYQDSPMLKPGFFDLDIDPATLSHHQAVVEFQDRIELCFKSSKEITILYDLNDNSSGQSYKQFAFCYVDPVDLKTATCCVKAPSPGEYKLSLYAKERKAADANHKWLGDFMLRCTSASADEKGSFPTAAGWGLNSEGMRMGLSFAGTKPMVRPDEYGIAILEFQCNKNTPVSTLYSVKKADDTELGNAGFKTDTDGGFQYSVAVPCAGYYSFTLFAKMADAPADASKEYVGTFLIDSDVNPAEPATFPTVYQKYDGCKLLEPTAGRLPSNSDVKFRLCVPKAEKVAVVADDDKWNYLENGADDLWEGTVSTVDVTTKVVVYLKREGSGFSGILAYTVA